MANEFSDRLKRHRAVKTWSQMQLAEKLNVSQGTISQWETGKQRPEDSQLEGLAQSLGCLKEDLLSDLALQFPNLGNRWLSEAEYTAIQQTFISNVGEDRLDVCLIGPDTLHLPDSMGLRETWVTNINAGANYRIVWFLDYIQEGTFQDLGRALREVGERIKGAKGKITHYATFGREDERVKSNLREFSRLKRELLDCGNVFYENDLSLEIRQSLLKFWNSFSSIVVIAPHESTRPAMASLTLRDVLPNLGGTEIDTWLFFNRAKVNELVRIVENVRSFGNGEQA